MNSVVLIAKNTFFPVCKNCVYNIYHDKIPKCTRFNYKNIITGHIELQYSSKCRKIDKCRKEGIYFIDSKHILSTYGKK